MVQQTSLGAAIGEQIRRRRNQRSMSAAELARRAGLSKATLSGLESGTGNPTIDTLDAVAQALGVPLADILTAPEPAGSTLIPGTDTPDEPVAWELLQRVAAGHQVETWRLRLAPGAAFDGVPHAEGTREQIVVAHGGVRAGHLDDLHDLTPGDCLVFDGTVPHSYLAGDDGVDAVVILTSPATL